MIINFRLNGCYEALTGGTLIEAFVDITGGVPETINVNAANYLENEIARSELFNYLKEAQDMKALMAAAIVVRVLLSIVLIKKFIKSFLIGQT